VWAAWLGIGLAAYAVFMVAVVVVLRAAKRRNAAERAHDAVDPMVPGARPAATDGDEHPALNPGSPSSTPDGSSESC
jgi:hypothetical protein